MPSLNNFGKLLLYAPLRIELWVLLQQLIGRSSYWFFEASVRIHLKLDDSEGLTTLPTAKIFKQLALIGVVTPLFDTMLIQHHDEDTSPSRITSSPSLSPQETPINPPSTSQPPNTPSIHTSPITKEATLMPHESPLHSVHLLRRDKGSLSPNELTVLYTSLSKKVESL
ncbi:hypothetical protein Tco_0868200 [Tanacetum coccineum]